MVLGLLEKNEVRERLPVFRGLGALQESFVTACRAGWASNLVSSTDDAKQLNAQANVLSSFGGCDRVGSLTASVYLLLLNTARVQPMAERKTAKLYIACITAAAAVDRDDTRIQP